MKLKITVYTPTGKYYASHTMELPGLEMSSPDFVPMVRNNLPGVFHDGLVVVEDAAENQGFHNAAFTWSYLFPEEYCGDCYEDMCVKRRDGKISEQEWMAWYNAYCGHCRYMNERCMLGEPMYVYEQDSFDGDDGVAVVVKKSDGSYVTSDGLTVVFTSREIAKGFMEYNEIEGTISYASEELDNGVAIYWCTI